MTLTERPWRIAVVGPGALGCLFGGTLALAGHSVAMLARRAEHAAALAREGIAIERNGALRRATVAASADPATLGPVDLAIVLVKSPDTAAAAAALPALLGPDGLALSLQNGLGNADQLAATLGPERVLGGITSQGAILLGPGRVRHLGFGPTALAEMVGGRSPRAEAVAALLDAAGIPARAEEAVPPLVWSKLLANVPINVLGTLLRCTNGQVVDDPASDELLARLIGEAVAVARAAGIELPVADPVEHVRRLARLTYHNRNSMLQDVEAGRRTEVDAINGAVAALGARLGVPTPLNDAMALLIRALERRQPTT
jgi:2-dehydropantoate 2-reductase